MNSPPLHTISVKGMRKDLRTPEEKAAFLYPRRGTLTLFADRLEFDSNTINMPSIIHATIIAPYSRLVPLYALWIETADATWVFGPHRRSVLDINYPFAVQRRWGPRWTRWLWAAVGLGTLVWAVTRVIRAEY